MPVYLFTYHAYRSWRPDDRRGYVRRGEGILPPDEEMARNYDRDARQPRVEFDATRQGTLVEMVRDVCDRRDWRLHQVLANPSHVHVLVSWDSDASWESVRDTFKRLMGMRLSQTEKVQGRQWFSKGASRKQVRDRKHFDYLMNEYLPKHQGERWREDQDQAT